MVCVAIHTNNTQIFLFLIYKEILVINFDLQLGFKYHSVIVSVSNIFSMNWLINVSNFQFHPKYFLKVFKISNNIFFIHVTSD